MVVRLHFPYQSPSSSSSAGPFLLSYLPPVSSPYLIPNLSPLVTDALFLDKISATPASLEHPALQKITSDLPDSASRVLRIQAWANTLGSCVARGLSELGASHMPDKRPANRATSSTLCTASFPSPQGKTSRQISKVFAQDLPLAPLSPCCVL